MCRGFDYQRWHREKTYIAYQRNDNLMSDVAAGGGATAR